MVRIFREKDRSKLFALLESRKSLVSEEITGSVRRIISEVRKDCDKALLKFTEKFDRIKMTARQLRVPERTLQAAAAKADPVLLRDLEKAIFNIHAYHARQMQKSWSSASAAWFSASGCFRSTASESMFQAEAPPILRLS